jgi:cellulose biosynthesis protein BcsQ
MPHIVMVSGKGGTGKTTLAFGIALTLNEAGKTFTIIDHDPQKSLTALLNQLPLSARRQPPVAVTIVDTPPRLDDANVRAVIKTADVLLVPTDSSPMDVPVTNNTAKLVESLRKETANAFVVLNKVRKRTFWNRQAEENPNEMFTLPVLKAQIGFRECYKHALLRGWKALDREAKDEISNLVISVL